GTGIYVFVILETTGRICPLAWSASLGYWKHFWMRTRRRRLIHSLISMPITRRRRGKEFTLLCITRANMSYPLVMSPLMVTCSIFRLGLSPLLLAASMTHRGGRAIVTRLTQRFKASARRMGKARDRKSVV